MPKRGGSGKAIWLSHAGLEGDEAFQNNSMCSKTRTVEYVVSCNRLLKLRAVDPRVDLEHPVIKAFALMLFRVGVVKPLLVAIALILLAIKAYKKIPKQKDE